MVQYCLLSVVLGAILILGPFISIPIPQLRVVFRDIRISGGAGVVLIALGVVLGALGFCG